MTNEKLDTVNELIAAARALRDHVRSLPESLRSGTSPNEVMRRDIGIRLDLIRAAQKVNATPSNSEANKVAGGMLLERIDTAVEAKSPREWEEVAHEAMSVVDEDSGEEITRWMKESQSLVDLGHEALDRAEEQGHAAMLEGFRRAAEQTPGADFRITEVFDDQVIKDETIHGPRRGEEDTSALGTGRMEFSAQTTLGLDADMTSVEVERVIVRQSKLLLDRHSLDATVSSEDVRLTVVQKMIRQTQRDLAIADVTGDLPAPIRVLGTEHFPALRAQLLMQHYMVLMEGALFSRTQQGDRSAVAVMRQMVVIADMLASAEPYFLPRDRIGSAVENRPGTDLPSDSTFLVWHDGPVSIRDDINVLAWVFGTDERGELDDIAHVVMLHDDGKLEASWCSLSAGEAATTARAVAATLSARTWDKPKNLRLPGKVESREWKKALVRSSGRARRGGLHGLHTLAETR